MRSPNRVVTDMSPQHNDYLQKIEQARFQDGVFVNSRKGFSRTVSRFSS